MKIILAVFRSRSQALDFISKLRANGLSATAVSTPKEANVGCGISAKINEAELFARAGGAELSFQCVRRLLRLRIQIRQKLRISLERIKNFHAGRKLIAPRAFLW
ncbi:MAG: putative Se/S carrier-like protein [Candidatus Borkfalkia sp.]